MNEENMKHLVETVGAIKQTLNVHLSIIKQTVMEPKDSIEN